jgi:glutamate synthase domain-containing protein 3
MTGGTVAVLGATGRNFGAGMSGGVAYVLDEDGLFKDRCNHAMVELEALSDAITPASHLGISDATSLKSLIENHAKYTGSQRAIDVLANWPKWSRLFVKVMADKKAALAGTTKQKAA